MQFPTVLSKSLLSLTFLALAATYVPAQEQHARETNPGSDALQRILAGGEPRSVEELRLFEQHVQGLLAQVVEATVSVGGGTGVLIPDGLVLTAGHVTKTAGQRIQVQLHGGRRLTGETLGANLGTDSGLVRVPLEAEHAHLTLGTSAEVKVGDWVLMLGHPSGRKPGRAAPARLGRVLQPLMNGRLITDCTMQSGDSGGPLVDMRGRIVGINTSITANLAQNQHVPIDAFHQDWDRLLAGEIIEAPRSRSRETVVHGIRLRMEESVLRVIAVERGSKGEQAGLVVDDVITHVGDQSVNDLRTFQRALTAQGREGEVVLQVARGEDSMSVQFTFETSSFQRPPTRGGRMPPLRPMTSTPSQRRAFAEATTEAMKSTAQVQVGGRIVALGFVVRSDGVLVTKASELPDPVPEDGIQVILQGVSHEASLLAADSPSDVALLKFDAKDLPVARFETAPPRPGAFLVSVGVTELPVGIGIFSCPPYAQPGPRPFLGVRTETGVGPARLRTVEPGSPADAAGLKPGDTVLAIDEVELTDGASMIQAIGRRPAGSALRLRVAREDQELDLEATLALDRRGRVQAQEPLWGPLSKVRSGFGQVLQHDTVLIPAQCGGPLVDLEGRIVGMNIARAGRVETLALPATVVASVVSKLLQ